VLVGEGWCSSIEGLQPYFVCMHKIMHHACETLQDFTRRFKHADPRFRDVSVGSNRTDGPDTVQLRLGGVIFINDNLQHCDCHLLEI